MNVSAGTVNINVPSWVPSSLVPTVSINALLRCDQFVGYIAVYRVCMAVASFFLLLMLVMICVCSSKDPRSYIQNGYGHRFSFEWCHNDLCVWYRFWIFKWLFVIGLVIAFFFIPEGSNFVFSRGMSYGTLMCVTVAYYLPYIYSVCCIWTYCIYHLHCGSDCNISGLCS